MIVPIQAGPSPRDLALAALKTAAQDYESALRMRTVAARLAKASGLTNQEIADSYGITEGAIRAMLKRAEGDA